jgi:predicted transcriptional regulator
LKVQKLQAVIKVRWKCEVANKLENTQPAMKHKQAESKYKVEFSRAVRSYRKTNKTGNVGIT